MSQGGFCLWKHSAYRLAICLAQSPQPQSLARSHLNKYLTKMKDCFTSPWKEQEALLSTPESEYFLFLECLCKNPRAAVCLELVWGCQGISWVCPSVLPVTLLVVLGSCGWGRALATGLGVSVLSCVSQAKEGQKPPTPKRGQEREPQALQRRCHTSIMDGQWNGLTRLLWTTNKEHRKSLLLSEVTSPA